MIRFEFETLVSNQAAALKMYALHFTRDEQDADDLVQDTVLKAMLYHEKFKEGTNLKGWLYTIMKNTFINNYRRSVRISNTVTKSDEISSQNLLYSATQNQGVSQFVLDDIGEAMRKLPEEYYTPFTMYFEGFKYQEIADHLQIPIGTVKTRIHVARKQLKKSLTTYATVPPLPAISRLAV